MKTQKMIKFCLVLTVTLLSSFCYSQSEYAVISDKDGYLNVREEPDSKSLVIGRIEEDEIFLVAEEESKQDWYYVSFLQEITEENTEEEADKMLDGRAVRYGYVQASSLRRLGEAEKNFMVNIDYGPDNIMVKDSIHLYMNIGRFIKRDSFIIKEGWGADTSMPRQQFHRAYLEINDQRYRLPTLGFYEPEFSNTTIIYDELMDDFIITMANGKGVAHYLCLWQISMDGEVKRYAFLPQ